MTRLDPVAVGYWGPHTRPKTLMPSWSRHLEHVPGFAGHQRRRTLAPSAVRLALDIQVAQCIAGCRVLAQIFLRKPFPV
jgi:hypothetical protein